MGRAARGTGEADGVDGHVVVQPHEVVLEGDLCAGRPEIGGRRQCEHRADGVVGDRKQPHADLATCRQRRSHFRQRVAGAQALRAVEMRRQVTVPEAKPALAPEVRQFVHDRPGLPDNAPTGLAVVHAGQCVGDRVEVGAYVQPMEDGVVAHIDDGGDRGRRNDAHDAREHAGSSDAAAKGDKHGASIEGTAPVAIRGGPWSAMGPAYWASGAGVRPLDGRNLHSGAIEV